MKRLIIVLCVAVAAQVTAAADTSSSGLLREYNQYRERTTVAAMSVLTGWSAVNLAVGTSLWLLSDDPVAASFHQMNAGWNIVNAAIAVPSLIGGLRARAAMTEAPGPLAPGDIAAALRAQRQIEHALLFNAGIDLAYVMTGLYLIERANRSGVDSAQLTGWGWSLALQGGFLFAFDLGAYIAQRQNTQTLEELLASLE
jgi:hypothetical protein